MIKLIETEERIEKPLNPEGKYRTVVLDTINALQNNVYYDMVKGRKGTYDAWRDFGVEILDLYRQIKLLPDTLLVQVLGLEGTGKTVGGKYLDPETNVWLNADVKPLSFFGAREKYPTDNSKKNYAVVHSYEEVLSKLRAIHSKRRGTLVVFVLGHLETYNLPQGGVGQRLKVLGKQATKLGLEGINAFATFYTKIDPTMPVGSGDRFKLQTSNSGFDTARTPEGYFDGDIPNNYQLIVNRILEDYGELVPKNSANNL